MLLKFDKSSMSFANKDKKKTSKKKADAALDSDPLDDDDMSTDVLADVTGKESALMEGENAENIDDDGNTVAWHFHFIDVRWTNYELITKYMNCVEKWCTLKRGKQSDELQCCEIMDEVCPVDRRWRYQLR